jgi:shikimate dehydrogenase
VAKDAMTNPALQEVIALLGHPAAGNPAQYLFERVVARDSLDWRFLTLEVVPERLPEALAGISAMGFHGCLLAGPLRQPAVNLVASVSPAAHFAGGCNLLEHHDDGRLIGHLTQGRGLLEAIRLHADPTAAPAVIIGTGLLARATALELTLAGVPELLIADPWDDDPTDFVSAVNAVEGGQAATLPAAGMVSVPEAAGLVIAAHDSRPLPEGCQLLDFRDDLVVADASLAPQTSPVLAEASAARACRVDGLEIATAIMAINFRQLTGIDPDTDLLREALDEFLDC